MNNPLQSPLRPHLPETQVSLQVGKTFKECIDSNPLQRDTVCRWITDTPTITCLQLSFLLPFAARAAEGSTNLLLCGKSD